MPSFAMPEFKMPTFAPPKEKAPEEPKPKRTYSTINAIKEKIAPKQKVYESERELIPVVPPEGGENEKLIREAKEIVVKS
jgi:hypothetical protein